jgi:hypothetical protein
MSTGWPVPDPFCGPLAGRFGSGAGAAAIEIVATLLTVKLLSAMSGLEQTVPKVD